MKVRKKTVNQAGRETFHAISIHTGILITKLNYPACDFHNYGVAEIKATYFDVVSPYLY